ncbi:MAG: urease accessory protein, partial [Oceanicoccus sp.]
MKECFRLTQDSVLEPDFKMELNFQQRQKSRYKAQTVCGETLGWFLDRGRVLEDGDLLLCEDDSS